MEATVAVTGAALDAGAASNDTVHPERRARSKSVSIPTFLRHCVRSSDVTSAKDGCSPSGQCGCCTVLIDGKASVSCQMSLAKIAGRSITTLEGFEAAERERFATAFAVNRRPAVRLLHARGSSFG